MENEINEKMKGLEKEFQNRFNNFYNSVTYNRDALAELLEVSSSTISRWKEKGLFDIREIFKIKELCGYDLLTDKRLMNKSNNVKTKLFNEDEDKNSTAVRESVKTGNSFVAYDRNGDTYINTVHEVKLAGYNVKTLNLIDIISSDSFNSFAYIESESDVFKMVDVVISSCENCVSEKTNQYKKNTDMFYLKPEAILLRALCLYLFKYRPKEEQSFTSVMKLLRVAEIDENSPSNKSTLDKIFNEVERTDPTSIALKQYKTFKMNTPNTLKTICANLMSVLSIFDFKEMEHLTCFNDFDFSNYNKVGVYIIYNELNTGYRLIENLFLHNLSKIMKNQTNTDLISVDSQLLGTEVPSLYH